MKSYDHKKIEKKWQKVWEKKKLYTAKNGSKKKKYYLLIEFPYPSGDGLHTGHVRSYTALDVVARKRRAEGYNVLYPIGWDAFGLPTENYAIKTGIHPKIVTKRNTDNFRRQLKSLGLSFDWSREINTTDPSYYKWTQWIFQQFFKKGLAYKTKTTINWCLNCKIGLANEEVVDGRCERCGGETEKREKEQWMLAITKYADRLYNDLESIDYLPQIKLQQRNWIGRNEGAEIEFGVKDVKTKIKVFTTRADTIFGATFLVLAPEHPLVQEWLKGGNIKNKDEVLQYIVATKKKSEMDRIAEGKEKTGVELQGVQAINPANQEVIQVFIADYVLGHYGTGAIMAVPAHDERDYAFAEKYKVPIKEVVMHSVVDTTNPPRQGVENTKRPIIIGVVHNPKTDKYLVLKWKKQPWKTFITGGIENGENAITSAMREIEEETGYGDLQFVKSLGHTEAFFYAAHKNVNRQTYSETLLFDLKSEARKDVAKEESDQHEVLWLTAAEVEKAKLQHAEFPVIWQKIKTGIPIYTGEGLLINSGKFSGLSTEEAKKKITESLGGKKVTTHKLRDWVFSRQRYWGEPIPLVHCEKDGWVLVPEKDLPVELPSIKGGYKPSDSGESPLAAVSKWVNVKCPLCKGPATRETDTMPNWAGSSWYFLRYADPKNKKEFASKKALDYWTPVDWYNGGMEHTTLHLLYSRFWHKFLYDLKLVPTNEPYKKRTSHGLILAEGGVKMSKSKGNVVNPDSIVASYGADSLRLYEMFMGPFEQSIAWDTKNIIGVRRFIERVWRIATLLKVTAKTDEEISQVLEITIKKVSDDIEAMKFNTAMSQMMIFINSAERGKISKKDFVTFLRLLAPFAPHVTEEIFQSLGGKNSIHLLPWPKGSGTLHARTSVKIAIQINGKLRGVLEASSEIDQKGIEEAAKSVPEASKWLSGKVINRVIYVPGRLINFLVKE